MKVSLQSTVATVIHEGILCRVWEGETAGGIKCYALIPFIAHHEDDTPRATEFFADLVEHVQASERAIQCFNIRSL